MADSSGFEKVEQEDAGKEFEVDELDDKNLDDVAGGDLSGQDFVADPGNGCVNNASHC